MTNLIIGWRGAGDPPSPWARWTDGDGRYLRFTATVADAKLKAGSSTHTHSVINLSITSCGQCTCLGGGSSQGVHTNHTLGSSTVTSANNDPEYYSFSLIYMDLATWEQSEKRFPVDSLVFSEGALSWSEVTRDTSADGKLIMLSSTPGQTGGTATRSHTATVTLGSGGSAGTGAGVGIHIAASGTHSHTVSGNISSSSLTTKPARITTRIYAANILTTKALSGVVCLVDGTPSANWSILSWTGYFLESANSDATSTGSSSQTHTGLSGTSGGSALGWTSANTSYTDATVATDGHTHTFTFNLGSSSIEPLYYNLIPVVLNSTLYHTVNQAAQLIGLTW